MSARGLVNAAFALAVSACAFEPALTQQLIDYNRAYEDSTNSILLLNVLRAKDRKPLYFTTLSQLNPSISGSGSLGLTIPLSPTAYTTLGISTGASVSTGNTGTVAVENTVEFVRGFMKPVDLETFEYFWSQGWPREMLLLLLVRRIEILPTDPEGIPLPGKKVKVLVNTPRSLDVGVNCPDSDSTELKSIAWCNFENFRDFVFVLEERVRFARSSTTVLVGPKVRSDDVGQLKTLIEAAKGGLEITQGGDGTFQVTQRVSTVTFCFPDTEIEKDDDGARRATQFECNRVSGTPQARRQPRLMKAQESGKEGRFEAQINATEMQRIQKEKKTSGIVPVTRREKIQSKFRAYFAECSPNCAIVLYIRSPEAMIYYLGEVIRTAMSSDYRQLVTAFENSKDPIFDVRKGASSSAGSHLTVRYDDSVYFVPRNQSNRAMHALSLISQLAGLQRKASDLPRTTTVNVVRP